MSQGHRTLTGWLPVVEFCAEEVRRQYLHAPANPNREAAVAWMLNGWALALKHYRPGRRPDPEFIQSIGHAVEPFKNRPGQFRHVGVRVGYNVKLDWQVVPRMIDNLFIGAHEMTPEEYYRQYEEIHPFVDGNGRTGKILFNYLRGTLAKPEFPPSFWGNIPNP